MPNLDDYTPDLPPASSETMDRPAAPTNVDSIKLGVGQTTYRIRRETLAKFNFFRNFTATPSSNTFNLVDVNEEVFPHIIAYLRRGTYPLAIDGKGRHDIPTYLALIEEAKYFQLDRLTKWLENGRYADAAKIQCSTWLKEETTVSATIMQDGKIVSSISKGYFPVRGKRLVYRCPRGIHLEEEGCGRKCFGARGDEDPMYDKVPTLSLLEVKKELVVDPKLCRDEEW